MNIKRALGFQSRLNVLFINELEKPRSQKEVVLANNANGTSLTYVRDYLKKLKDILLRGNLD